MAYLALGDRLTERLAGLRQRWPSLALGASRELGAVEDQPGGERLPAVYVLYLGDSPGEPQGRGSVQVLDQQWAVVPSVSDYRTAAETWAEMGELLDALHARLLGWQPGGDHGPLRRVGGARAVYRGSALRVPLLFRSRLLRVAAALTEET